MMPEFTKRRARQHSRRRLATIEASLIQIADHWGDLNDRLFAQLDRMASKTMTAEQIETEVKRTEAIVAVADTIVRNANTQLTAAKLFAQHGKAVLPMLPQIGHGKDEP